MTSKCREFKPVVGAQASFSARQSYTAEIRKRKKLDTMNQRRWNNNLTQEPVMTEEEEAFQAVVALNGQVPNESLVWMTALQNGIQGWRALRREISKPESHLKIEEYVKRGVVPLACAFLELSFNAQTNLSQSSAELFMAQYEAAWCLANIAAGKHAIEILRQPGGIDILGKLIKQCEHHIVREMCLWCVANIAGMENGEQQDRLKMLSHGEVMTGIYKNIANPANVNLLKNCIWALANLMQGAQGLQMIKEPLENILYILRNVHSVADPSEKDGILDEVLSALRKSMMNNPDAVEFLGKSTGFITIIAVLAKNTFQEKNICLAVRAWRCMDLLAGNQQFVEKLLTFAVSKKTNIVSMAKKVLTGDNPDFHLVAEVCSTLTSVLEAPNGMKEINRQHVVRDAIDITFICPGDWKPDVLTFICQYLLKGRRLEHYCYILESETGLTILHDYLRTSNDVVLTRRILDAFEYMLKVDSERDVPLGVEEKLYEIKAHDLIRQLQQSGDEYIHKKACSIVDDYLDHKEEGEDHVGDEPENDGQSFLFATKNVGPIVLPQDLENLSALLASPK